MYLSLGVFRNIMWILVEEWSGEEWRKEEWRGVEWRGVEWRGVEWRGVERRVVERRGEEWTEEEWRGDMIDKGCDVMGANNVTCGIVGSMTAIIVDVGIYLRTI